MVWFEVKLRPPDRLLRWYPKCFWCFVAFRHDGRQVEPSIFGPLIYATCEAEAQQQALHLILNSPDPFLAELRAWWWAGAKRPEGV